MQAFNEAQFRRRVDAALERVKTLLENERKPRYAADVRHEYGDKYLLAEFLVNSAVSALGHALQASGLSEKALAQLRDWASERSVTLRLRAEERCKFARKVEREVQSDTKSVSKSTLFGTRETYTVTKVTEYFWTFDAKYDLVAFSGTDDEKPVVLQGRSGTTEIKTSVESTPKPATVVRPALDVNITWLLQRLDSRTPFTIDRQHKSCHTPRRNVQVEEAITFFTAFYQWCGSVQSYFTGQLFPVQADHGLDLNALADAGVFVPVLPLFEKAHHKSSKHKHADRGAAASSGPVSSSKVQPATALQVPLLAEQERSLTEKFGKLSSAFPNNGKLITSAEAKLVVTVLHLRQVCQALAEGVDYIEDMLRRQLIAAIGKEVQPADFSEYLSFHQRKLYRPEYQPRPFCYAVRRLGHYPEGTVSVEAVPIGVGDAIPEPILTSVCSAHATRPMRFALDAATEVSVGGERHLHAWISHQFSGQAAATLSLTSRARQFSSFLVLVGSIASADLFLPKYGFIIQNKDDLRIPLELETIPTPKEFRDAIESMSPEQQRFAKAFRSMQLASTLFGVCVIQIKPAMERLLNLPDDSLTKEIELTQDLQRLFIEYQIPSDLLSYDGEPSAGVGEKIETVRGYVANMKGMLDESKKEQLEEAKQQQRLRIAENDALKRMLAEAQAQAEVEERKRYEVTDRRRKSEMVEKRVMKEEVQKKDSGGMRMKEREASSSRSDTASLNRVSIPISPSAAPAVSAVLSGPKPSPVSTAPSGSGSVVPAVPSASVPKPPAQKAPEAKEVSESEGVERDLSKVPAEIERKMEELDVDGALRPTILKAGSPWSKREQKALLAAPSERTLGTDEQTTERQRAFDLLDALTKSGALALESAALHVIIAATHCFDKTLMNTLVQDNINPVEKVERSALILASTVHNRRPAELLQPDQLQRVATYSPMLIEHSEQEAAGATALKKL